jgi:hypothetical protein
MKWLPASYIINLYSGHFELVLTALRKRFIVESLNSIKQTLLLFQHRKLTKTFNISCDWRVFKKLFTMNKYRSSFTVKHWQITMQASDTIKDGTVSDWYINTCEPSMFACTPFKECSHGRALIKSFLY